jgi:hypothetical protein
MKPLFLKRTVWLVPGLLLLAGWSLLAGACGKAERPLPEPQTRELRISPQPFSPPAPSQGPPTEICLTDVSDQSAITWKHHDGSSGQRYLIEPSSAGVALFDYDGDGWIDIYFVSGTPLPPGAPDPTAANALYRNEGGMRFRDVTHEAGVGSQRFGLGVAVGDYDNDGDADLYVNNFGPNVLYRNNGDGTFTDVTQEAGVACGLRAGAGASFLDMEGDGDLDLFVANYVNFRLDNNVQRTTNGFPCYPGPLDFQPKANFLFRNDGEGRFTDVSRESGIAQAAGSGMGTIVADYDQDDDSDIFVANDEMGNFLFENDGSGKFREVGVLRGFAYGLDGRPRGNMAVDCADYDNDGWLDFFTTTYAGEMVVLYRNSKGSFEDFTHSSGAGAGSLPHVKWGAGFADFDNDRDADLFVACGGIDQEVHRWRPSTAYRLRNLLLMNAGDGKFVDVSDRCGDGLLSAESSRGSGLDDLDNDGDVDMVVLNSRASPTVIRNDADRARHWLQVELRGTAANRDGVGAQVRVTAGGQTQLAEIHSGRGYQSHHGSRLHFGLGECDRVERVEVRWPGGRVQTCENLPANQLARIVENTSPASSGSE